MKTYNQNWMVQADPDNVGKHPLHDNRFITTEGFSCDEIDAAGVIVCKMTDLGDQKQTALLISKAPELLRACRCALADLEGIMPKLEAPNHPAWTTIGELRGVLAPLEDLR